MAGTGNSEIKEEYTSSLADLTVNSKPLISVLTILAEENVAHAKDIVEAIETHLLRVRTEVKLPVLYLIDCIIKNVGGPYTALFCQNIVSTFCSVFEQVDERTRSEMFRLRQTWNEVLPPKKLYALDVQIHLLDPAWPVTATPPNNSIHLNPKFLKPATAAASTNEVQSANIISKPLAPVSASSGLDPETLSMQQKLINKQKELLELQQRKIELELLQTQVKLQEQLKHQIPNPKSGNVTVPSKISTPHSQNLLLKPEVAKQQLLNSTASSKLSNAIGGNGKTRGPTTHAASSVNNGPRIAPVSGALINARPIRDPRLLRHQQHVPASNFNSNVHLESKTKSNTPVTVDSNNKIVISKKNVRESRVEPRLVNNKGNTQLQGKAKAVPRFSPPKHNVKPTDSPRKSFKVSRSKSGSSTDLSDSKSSSTSSLSSPIKLSKSGKIDSPTKSRSRSSSKSPSKLKKKVVVRYNKDTGLSTHSDKDNLVSRTEQDVNAHCLNSVLDVDKDSNISRSTKKSDKQLKSPKSDSKSRKVDNSSTFKDIKVSTKNRNYVRRNRNSSLSPERSHDVDLRMGAPPEKQLRLQSDIMDDKSSNNEVTNMDVDLRQLPAVIGKKRSSVDNTETSSLRKSKTEAFDVLFGSEDTDLRQLPPVLTSPKAVERPPTPPPPIISEKTEKAASEIVEILDDMDIEKKDVSPKPANLDQLRAKLANATIKEKLNKSKLRLTVKRKGSEGLTGNQEDTDMRSLSSLTTPDVTMNKIIISSADEQCIKAGNMTKAQETALMNKIIAQLETQKLREAQRKESESFTNISLQPISDDELEPDMSSSESENENPRKNKYFGDKDDRLLPPLPHLSSPSENYLNKYQRVMNPRDRRTLSWRGGRCRQKMWDNAYSGPPIPRHGFRPRPGLDPWVRAPNQNQGPWRPMGPSFIKPPMHPDGFGLGPMDNVSDINCNAALHGGDHTNLSPNHCSNNQEIPEELVIDNINQDSIKSINIDGVSRDIKYYDEVAVAFMSWDDPREISFQNGSRRVNFDDEVFTLSFDESYKDVTINGNVHKVRLGAPTREIYVNGKWYECYFGGPGIGIELEGKITVLKLEGPPPQVKIGKTKRTDLVAGRVNLIIDAKSMVPVFLDAKVQKFYCDGQTHTLQFVDALKTVLINDIPFQVEFGGLPKPITLHDRKHFIRFSVLPRGVKAGHVSIKDMDGCQMPDSPINDDENSQDAHLVSDVDTNEPALPVLSRKKRIIGDESPDRNSNSPLHFQNLIQQQNFNNLDMLSSVIASSVTPSSSVGGYQVENVLGTDNASQSESTNTTNILAVSQPSTNLTGFNINELFQRLVATGIVTTAAPDVPAPLPQIKATNSRHVSSLKNIKPVYFDRPDTLKIRQQPIIHGLYVGMQCSSCGMRFPPEQSMYYSQHLDWHFRQNRKGKRNIRKAASRRWYYSLSDWKNYEELEDLEEREKSYFENQQQAQAEGGSEEGEEEIEIPSVPADPDVQNVSCEVCRDRFEQFYNEEKEEWHLRMAIRVDGKTYHPLCYEDYQASLQDTMDDSKNNTTCESEKEKANDKIPGLEVSLEEDNKMDVDDDDEPEIIEDTNLDASKQSETFENETKINDDTNTDCHNQHEDDDEDDDVIINEIVPEKIVLDDDGDYNMESTSDHSTLSSMVVKKEPLDDGFIDIENGLVKLKTDGEVKIKTEPIDPDEIEAVLPQEEESVAAETADSTHIEVISSIDGNVELDSGLPAASGISGKIKINITKPITVIPPKEIKDNLNDGDVTVEFCDPTQPLPPGEEPVQLNVKSALKGIDLKKLPVVKKGSELTGLCSIM